MRGPGRRGLASGVFCALGLAVPSTLLAQDAPPPPGPTPDFRLPPLTERGLPGGAHLVVAEDREQPFVAVHLAFPGGRLLEPRGLEGTAALVAGLLPRGAGDRSAAEIAREADLLGAELEVVAEDDAFFVRLEMPSADLERGVRLLTDLVRRPAFPEEELEELRRRSTEILEARLRSPDLAVGRALRRAVYGEGHPYAALETPASIRSVERDDLVRFHRRALGPRGTRIAVVGDVDPDAVVALLERTLLAGWDGAAPEVAAAPPSGPARAVPPPARRGRPEVLVVHDPAARTTAVEVGHVVPGASAPEWPALAVLGEVLDRRLAGLFRERGWAHPVTSGLERRTGWSLLRIGARVPGAVADTVAAALLATLEGLRRELVRPRELGRATGVLVGSFLLGLEGPEDVADALVRVGLHGRTPESLTAHPTRIESPGPVDLREVARAHLHVEEAVVAVVGDAVRRRAGLRDLGPVTVVDRSGRLVDPAALSAPAEVPEWDASVLEPRELVYRLSIRGAVRDPDEPAVGEPSRGLTPVGEIRRRLEPAPDADPPTPADPAEGPVRAMRFLSEMAWIGSRMRQEVTFTVPGFEPLAGSFSVAGRLMAASLRVSDGRVTGRIRLPDRGEREVDRPFPGNALLGEMEEIALWLLEPEEGAAYRFRVVSLESAEPVEVRVRVLASEMVAVPAGRFPARLLEVVSGDLVQRVHVRREPPHLVLRLETPGQPVVMELEEWR